MQDATSAHVCPENDSPLREISRTALRSPLSRLLLDGVTSADGAIGLQDLFDYAACVAPGTTVPEFCRALTDLVEQHLVAYHRASRGYAPAASPAKREGA